MTDPWLPPPAQPYAPPTAPPHAPQSFAPQAYAPQPYASQPYAPQPYAPQPYAPQQPGRRGNGVAIAALVVAVLALLGVIGLGLVVLGTGVAGGLMGTYELEGTLGGATEGRVYSPDEVRSAVEEVLDDDWSTYADLECEELAFEPGAYTSCEGVVDGMDTELELEVVGSSGRFVLSQYW